MEKIYRKELIKTSQKNKAKNKSNILSNKREKWGIKRWRNTIKKNCKKIFNSKLSTVKAVPKIKTSKIKYQINVRVNKISNKLFNIPKRISKIFKKLKSLTQIIQIKWKFNLFLKSHKFLKSKLSSLHQKLFKRQTKSTEKGLEKEIIQTLHILNSVRCLTIKL